MKHLTSSLALATLLLSSPGWGQFLPPGLPHPDNAGEDVMADHVLDGSTIHLVWASNVDYTQSSGADPDIFYMRFDGSSWSWPVLVNTYGQLDNGGPGVDEHPRLAVGPDGTLHCVWQSDYALGDPGTDFDVFYSRRPPGGDWQPAEPISTSATADYGWGRWPNVIARANGDPLVVWLRPEQVGLDDRLFSRIRTLGGWTPAVIFPGPLGNDSADFGAAGLARAENGTIVAVFSTKRLASQVGGDADIAYSLLPSVSGWTTISLVTTDAIADSGHDHDPAVAIVGSGEPGDFEIHVVWASTNDVAGNGIEGDILATVLRFPVSPGATRPSFLVNSNGIGDSASDDLPSLCVEPGGVVHAVWHTRDAFFADLDLLHATNATSGADWSPSDLLNVTALGPDGNDQGGDLECGAGGILSGLWQSTNDLGGIIGSDHDLFHAFGLGRVVTRPASIDAGAAGDLGDDRELDLAVGPDGILHAVWSSDDVSIGGGTGSDRDVFYARLDATGWTTPELVNPTGSGDGANVFDGLPAITVGTDGRVHVAWSSEENIGGDTGTDSDVFHRTLDGDVWSTPELVNSYGHLDSRHDIWVDLVVEGPGAVQAIWMDGAGSDRRVFWARRSTSGWSAAEVASGSAQPSAWNGPALSFVVDPSRVPHLVWASTENVAGTGADEDLFYAHRSAGGWSTPELVNSWGTFDGNADEHDCVLSRGADGELQVIWQSKIDPGGTGPDSDLFIARRSAAGWSDPQLLLAAFASDAAEDRAPRVLRVGQTLHLAWESNADLGLTSGTDFDIFYAALDLDAPLPAAPFVLLGNPAGHGDAAGEELTALTLSPEGALYFGFSTGDDLGGTMGFDDDVFITSLAVEAPRIFTDGFESGNVFAWSGSSP